MLFRSCQRALRRLKKSNCPKAAFPGSQVVHPTIPGLFLLAPKPKRTKIRSSRWLENTREEEAMVE